MCDCISYNGQTKGQTGTPEVELTSPCWLAAQGRPTVCIDACIVDLIEAVWRANIKTFSCCCGHNGQYQAHLVVPETNATRANAIAQTYHHDMQILFWRGDVLMNFNTGSVNHWSQS